ncbi:hypothetical protein DFA_08312 [Cavenderia fasciculata]|uniref:Uncharacterized protein n=1 Tax=Cavenderia fasciculata TaxID=261658 RepID=F4Q5R0_CACFS|nr:uncharacterized protein DFA_08312 [Cavenderia fasciculata]EGG17319.1 hypothetical protein DFA_08312 [Cavenderia fasciculata]|eukprot:XP_004355803.1 hypothetical protein DFA_08312 [Cavenderia fasciculata]
MREWWKRNFNGKGTRNVQATNDGFGASPSDMSECRPRYNPYWCSMFYTILLL